MSFIRSFLVVITFFFISCVQNLVEKENNNSNYTLFSQVPSSKSGVSFTNKIEETIDFNFINYPYIFNGGGVASGDINNDGLIDLYFSSNQGSNKLYLNKGNFQFEDITIPAGVADDTGWTTGISMIDIDNDGWLDLYICKSASLRDSKNRENKLFINNGDKSFREAAESYNLNDVGFSSQAYFLDYDNDGDLDMYLVNHRPDFENNASVSPNSEVKMDTRFSDQLYKNVGGSFENVTEQAGILSFTWGLSATISDFNNDDWPDIYVCNDFLEGDKLYINNQDGTFENNLSSKMSHIPLNSMGSDIGDINNDGLNDLMVVEMSPNDHVRSKNNMPSMRSENFEKIVASGNHYQYMSNTLQLNNGVGRFSEIGQLAKVAKTDWSWASLIADFDNDGLNDIFITNGIAMDLANSDFRKSFKQKITNKEKLNLDDVISMVPSNKISNYMFHNNGDLTFGDSTISWGLDMPSFSNGAAYADLDDDGDLDIVINNLNDEAVIYKNSASANYLKIKLTGSDNNKMAIGAVVQLYIGDHLQRKEVYLIRGFQSSISSELIFGLGETKEIDSLIVTWPDGNYLKINRPAVNQAISLSHANGESFEPIIRNISPILTKISPDDLRLYFRHVEKIHDDFEKQVLLPHKLSQNGPFMSIGDVNNDTFEDVFIGGAASQAGVLYMQTMDGNFIKSKSDFERDSEFEDMQSVFIDYDSDGDLDLYVVSGSSEFEENSPLLQDRLYENDSKGNFSKTHDILPQLHLNGQSVAMSDFDKDGDFDLFIGGRQLTNKYPYSPKSYFLINNNGIFNLLKDDGQSSMDEIGMVTNALFTDYDLDGDEDLLVVGEWTSIQFYENNEGYFNIKNIPELENTVGLWFGLAAEDIDNDGDEDYFIGNLGLNAKYNVDENSEIHIFCDDFDNSGTFDIVLSSSYKGNLVPVRGKECSTQQMPFIEESFSSYSDFASANLIDILGKENLKNAKHIELNMLESIYLENLGDDNFKIKTLPNQVQKSPIMGFEFADIDNDNISEIFIVGNFYPVEVESIRYDAGNGGVLKFQNNNITSINSEYTGFNPYLDMRDIAILDDHIGNRKLILISNNNDNLEIFKIN